MKIAIVHEWFTTYAGSEKVLAAMLEEFPQADIFSQVDFLSDEDRAHIGGRHAKTSFIQKLPFAKKNYRYYFPLMPLAVEQHDLSGYDVIVSNSHSVAKGIIVGPDQLHICYCYSPMRYAWDLQNQYLSESGIVGFRGAFARLMLHFMRIWDTRTAAGVDHFIACSRYISRRILKSYRRDSTVIYPNVDVDSFVPGNERDDFYVTSSRMVPYKKIHLIVEAFARMPHRKLVVIGDGPQFKRIKALATPNISVLGFQEFPVLLDHLQRARAFLFAAEEDFGIAPLEAQACGTPVIAFARGGASETVIDGVTGVYFHEQTPEAICDAVARFEELPPGHFDEEELREHARSFSTAMFRDQFRTFVEDAWAAHCLKLAPGRSRPHGLGQPMPIAEKIEPARDHRAAGRASVRSAGGNVYDLQS
ncbi:glycosyltransferase family 4 protein [Ancylobacter sp. 6x-1]|uniref:Glycosyltransferase family 4 protein n=1 Tax=Ancylobacter crimeensis TaxID=2579147 RepID=A0ABT0D992_9HYPH|nr:glycosyltransferase family 4 protein [Ancylobacter crimeensis]MCK0196474.1 glycosyltransferase family 4 protein [Ancylobacter crimeensis]